MPNEIPKIIHYCWFGRTKLPESAQKCIASWKKFFYDYEIKEWNEDNFDVNIISYTAEAYSRKKYAFVSDYARFFILYNYGGVYFDTDVEVVKDFSPILQNGAFMGCERDSGEEGITVAPGLGIAATRGMSIYRVILDYYSSQQFLLTNGDINTETVVTKTTKVLSENGLQNIPGIQNVAGITVYPSIYFCPDEYSRNSNTYDPSTYSAHHYSASWRNEKYNKKLRSPLWGRFIKVGSGVANAAKKLLGQERWTKFRNKFLSKIYNKFRGI